MRAPLQVALPQRRPRCAPPRASGSPRRSGTPLALLLALASCVGTEQAGAQLPPGVEGHLREGRYPEAIELLQTAFSGSPNPANASNLLEILLEAGRFGEAVTLARDQLNRTPGVSDIHLHLGRALRETGAFEEAETAFRAGMEGSGSAVLLAEVELGRLQMRRGRQAEALAIFDRFIDVYNQSGSLGARDLLAVGTAVRELGVTNPALYADALRAYDEAVALEPSLIEAHLGAGFLLLDRYNLPDARASLREVLSRRGAHPQALLGLARAAEIEGLAEMGPLVERALAVNPDLVPALVLRAQAHLSGENVEAAIEDLERALLVNPSATEAMAIRAAAFFMQGRMNDYAVLRDRALAINPIDATFFVGVADLLSKSRYYAEAAEMAGMGAALDSLAWSAFGAQGLNQLRVGDMSGGRESLERAFRGDPFNVWIKNTLDLLDLMEGFERYEGKDVQVFVDPEDGEALALYMIEIGDRAYSELSGRYQYTPPSPIRLEAFRRSADFSVRTVGLTGLGALGVAFGTVVAMDSPAARGAQGFHWGSTLWHEMAHVLHLGITDHRVPRWFSEGLAVHEERRAGPGWGNRPSLPFLASFLEGRLRAPSELSRSFVSPRFPEEVGYAYILGSVVFDWIESTRGFAPILRMLHLHAEGRDPEAVIREALGFDLATFDARFDSWFRERYARPLAAAQALMELRETPPQARMDPEWLERRTRESPDDLESRMVLGRLFVQSGRQADALRIFEEARTIFPDNPDPQGPDRMIAQLHLDMENEPQAVVALRRHLLNVSNDYTGHLLLAELLEKAGDAAGAARSLEEAILVYPFEISVHTRLAGLYRGVGDLPREIRERRAVLALSPVDRAGALYELAEAQFRAGELEAAQGNVLRALAAAPRYPEAQDLLLAIMERGSGG